MLDAERVLRTVAGTRFCGNVRALASVDSTNRVVATEAAAGAVEGLVVVADHQTAGRGRRDRTWEAPAGTALLVSVLLRPPLEPDDLYLVTAAVALSARAACTAVAQVDAELKWPNDLLIGDRKLAGILAETSGGAVVAGLGLNVSDHPEGATSLTAAGWPDPDREALLADLLIRLDRMVDDWPEVRRQHRQTCATVGRVVRVERDGGSTTGTVTGLDDHGRLLLRPAAGGPVLTISAGDVVHLRPV